MNMHYEIPQDGDSHLTIGNWVEIFEAYGDGEDGKAIQVKSMRVGGKILVFRKGDSPSRRGKALRPHEGEVVHVDRGPAGTQFRLRLRP